jgi:hypothetical protein
MSLIGHGGHKGAQGHLCCLERLGSEGDRHREEQLKEARQGQSGEGGEGEGGSMA